MKTDKNFKSKVTLFILNFLHLEKKQQLKEAVVNTVSWECVINEPAPTICRLKSVAAAIADPVLFDKVAVEQPPTQYEVTEVNEPVSLINFTHANSILMNSLLYQTVNFFLCLKTNLQCNLFCFETFFKFPGDTLRRGSSWSPCAWAGRCCNGDWGGRDNCRCHHP